MKKNILLLAGALAISGQVQAASYDEVVNWAAFDDITAASKGSGTISAGSYILNPVLDTAGNDTGYKVDFSISAALSVGAALDAKLGSAGAGFEWFYTGTEWRGSAGATSYGQATNNSQSTQTINTLEARTIASIGFGSATNPGGALGFASSIAAGSFNAANFDPSQTLTPAGIITLTANPITSALSAWVANNSLTAFGRGTALNTQSGTGNLLLEITNRANFYVEARHNYDKRAVPTNVPEPAMLGLMGLGFAAMGAARRRRQA